MVRKTRKFWDKSLYIEGIRQTKWLAVIMFLMTAVILTYQAISEQLIEFGFMYIGICIIAMIMIYRLFSFQNRRVSSDMYHGLPKNRGSIYTSFGTAALSWFVIEIPLIIVINDIVSQNGINRFLHLETNIMDSLYYMAGIVQVIGITMLAMSLTGNTVANVLAAFSIMFVPGLLLNSYVDVFYELCPYLTKNHTLLKIINPDFNVIFSLLRNIGNTAYDKLYGYVSVSDSALAENTDIIAIIYSLVIGLIYMIAGGFFFSKRMSENAGKSTTSGFLQLAMRLAVAMAVCIIPTSMLSRYFVNGQYITLAEVILWYFIAIFIWFIIEIITNKKVKGLKTSLIQLPILVVFNVIIGTVLVTGTIYTNENVPEADSVRAVRILGDFSIDYIDGTWYQVDYKSGEFLRQIKLESREEIELLVDKLDKEMTIFRENYYKYNYNEEDGGFFEVAFETEEGTIYRNLLYDMNVQKNVYEALKKAGSEVYEYEMPISKSWSNGNRVEYYGFPSDISGKKLYELYETLYEELSESKYPMSMYMGNIYENPEAFGCLIKTEGAYNYCLPVSVNTPKTLEKLIELTDKGFTTDYIDPDKEDVSDSSRTLKIRIYSATDKLVYSTKKYWNSIEDIRTEEETAQILMAVMENKEELSVGENLIAIDLWYSDHYIGCGWCNVTDEEVKDLLEMENLNW